MALTFEVSSMAVKKHGLESLGSGLFRVKG